KLDAQTLQGKGPAAMARRALRRGLPVAAVAGAITLAEHELTTAGIRRAWALTSRGGSARRALEEGEPLLVEVGRDLGAWAVAATGPDAATAPCPGARRARRTRRAAHASHPAVDSLIVASIDSSAESPQRRSPLASIEQVTDVVALDARIADLEKQASA